MAGTSFPTRALDERQAVNMAQAKLTRVVAFVFHAGPGGHGRGSRVAWHDQADQSLQAELVAGVLDDSAGSLGSETLAPPRLVDHVSQLHLRHAVDGPWQ